jgi:hypothetical protein
MIEETITADRPTRRPALATDERSAWVSSAQQGIGSFFSYRAVAVELDGVEVRPFAPPIIVEVGFIHRAGRISAQGGAMIGLAQAGTAPVGCQPVGAD